MFIISTNVLEHFSTLKLSNGFLVQRLFECFQCFALLRYNCVFSCHSIQQMLSEDPNEHSDDEEFMKNMDEKLSKLEIIDSDDDKELAEEIDEEQAEKLEKQVIFIIIFFIVSLLTRTSGLLVSKEERHGRQNDDIASWQCIVQKIYGRRNR